MSGSVDRGVDWAIIRGQGDQPVAVFVICDDCRSAYLEPAYYSFEAVGCLTTDNTPDGEEIEIYHMNTNEGCTGNMCPDCTGPYLDPDDPDDPRRPAE